MIATKDFLSVGRLPGKKGREGEPSSKKRHPQVKNGLSRGRTTKRELLG